MAADIPRAKLEELRAQLVKDREVHVANVNAAGGGIQVLDLLLAEPAVEPLKTEDPAP